MESCSQWNHAANIDPPVVNSALDEKYKYTGKDKYNDKNEGNSPSEDKYSSSPSLSPEKLTDFEFEEGELSWFQECERENHKMEPTLLSSSSPSSPI